MPLSQTLFLNGRISEMPGGISCFHNGCPCVPRGGRCPEMGWVGLLNTLEHTGYSYSVNNWPANSVDNVCGNQPPRWPQSPTSWYLHVCSHLTLYLDWSEWSVEYGRKIGMSLPRLGHNIHCLLSWMYILSVLHLALKEARGYDLSQVIQAAWGEVHKTRT